MRHTPEAFLYKRTQTCVDGRGDPNVAIQAAMKWDEDKFGLEYDLDIFNVVAVNDFNMGAMENKGLNVFNTAFVLAKPGTANK